MFFIKLLIFFFDDYHLFFNGHICYKIIYSITLHNIHYFLTNCIFNFANGFLLCNNVPSQLRLQITFFFFTYQMICFKLTEQAYSWLINHSMTYVKITIYVHSLYWWIVLWVEVSLLKKIWTMVLRILLPTVLEEPTKKKA